MLMGMYTRVNGLTIKLTGKELTRTLTVLTIMESGLMINSTAGAWNHGLMEPNMKDSIETARKMERAS